MKGTGGGFEVSGCGFRRAGIDLFGLINGALFAGGSTRRGLVMLFAPVSNTGSRRFGLARPVGRGIFVNADLSVNESVVCVLIGVDS